MKRLVKICEHCSKYRNGKKNIAQAGSLPAKKMLAHSCMTRCDFSGYMSPEAFEEWDLPSDCRMQLEYLVMNENK